ncbi:uncharacterized protein K460DRAFT_428936 [Cucurbitaria berberidis CBS 394.84]|uniref:Uncharacterized protein n=1 Tax=Cucurbitaria berberidis CBS 394.84 TaxID=1168544 RepID=A0A9P4GQ65_9PLEO|nr:uncharacterized protein K460DRAFT_428936 [Cucurbitaria berberidis CBS 394.84]KAF1849376.1 hypothetical protein K460DRAFT_428936 [Cucurbitaria berberidis CBS 394.84]
MPNPTGLPYLQPSSTFGVYRDPQTGQVVQVSGQQPEYLQHPPFMGMPQPNSNPFAPQSYFAAPGLQYRNGPSQYLPAQYLQMQQMQMEIQQRRPVQQPTPIPSIPFNPVQVVLPNQVQNYPVPTFAPPPSSSWAYPPQQPQQRQAPQQAWNFAENEVVDVDMEDAPQVVAPVFPPEQTTLEVPKEATPEPPKRKEPSFLAERVRYLKTKTHEQKHPVEIRLIRTFELNMDTKQQRKYCLAFWPSNEAALEDLHDMAKFSPNFTEIYMYRMRWEASATVTEAKKIEDEKTKMEAEKEELRGSCRAKYQEMLEAERDAQERTFIGSTRRHKGVEARKRQLREYEESKKEKQAMVEVLAKKKEEREAEEARKKMEAAEEREEKKQEREAEALRKKEASALKKADAATKRKADAEEKKRKRADDKLEKTSGRPAKAPKTGHTQALSTPTIEEEDDLEAVLAQQMFAELSDDTPADASSLLQEQEEQLHTADAGMNSSPSQGVEEEDDLAAMLAEEMLAELSADTPASAASPPQEEQEQLHAPSPPKEGAEQHTDGVAKPSELPQMKPTQCPTPRTTPAMGQEVEAQQQAVDAEQNEDDFDALFDDDGAEDDVQSPTPAAEDTTEESTDPPQDMAAPETPSASQEQAPASDSDSDSDSEDEEEEEELAYSPEDLLLVEQIRTKIAAADTTLATTHEQLSRITAKIFVTRARKTIDKLEEEKRALQAQLGEIRSRTLVQSS